MPSIDQLLSLRLDHDNGGVRISLRGDLDASTAPDLLESLQDSLAGGISNLVVDLRELEFIDSAGLSLLVTTHKRAERDGVNFLLARPGPQTLRLLQVAGLVDFFTFE